MARSSSSSSSSGSSSSSSGTSSAACSAEPAKAKGKSKAKGKGKAKAKGKGKGKAKAKTSSGDVNPFSIAAKASKTSEEAKLEAKRKKMMRDAVLRNPLTIPSGCKGDGNTEYGVYQIVWAKYARSPYWPALVSQEELTAAQASGKPKTKLMSYFFGTYDCAPVSLNRIETGSARPAAEEAKKKGYPKAYATALIEAQAFARTENLPDKMFGAGAEADDASGSSDGGADAKASKKKKKKSEAKKGKAKAKGKGKAKAKAKPTAKKATSSKKKASASSRKKPTKSSKPTKRSEKRKRAGGQAADGERTAKRMKGPVSDKERKTFFRKRIMRRVGFGSARRPIFEDSASAEASA